MTKPLSTLRVLADEARLRILGLLANRELCVCELVGALKLSQPLVSHHLRILRDAGLLATHRKGKWIYYTLTEGRIPGEGGKLVSLVRDWAQKEGTKPEDRKRLVDCLSQRFGLAECGVMQGKGCPHPERGGAKPKAGRKAPSPSEME
jgi:ArsR family transcriptional regulator, arsenate/arsenite/antimonite-responsive transcriptional repressor